MDGRAWWAAVHGVAKGWTRLSDLTFSFHFHSLEKEMATHSSVLACTTGAPSQVDVDHPESQEVLVSNEACLQFRR